jgi:hypothetical protein
MCNAIGPTEAPLQTKIDQIISAFQPIFENYWNQTGRDTNCSTAVTFAGYDPDNKIFFMTKFDFNGPNPPAPNKNWQIQPEDRAGRCAAIGQEKFIGTLFNSPSSGEDKLRQYRSDTFKNTLLRLGLGVPVTDEEIRDWMLGIFDLDQKQAIALGLDNRPISGPYRIVKVTSTNVTLLH